MTPQQRHPFIKFLNEVQRARSGRQIAGVCAGMAKHSDVPLWAYRAMFIGLIPLGVGILGYIALWIFMPLEGSGQTAKEETPAPDAPKPSE